MNRGAQRGLTLVEVLVALVITGVVLGAAFGGLHVAVAAWESGNRHGEWAREERLVEQWIVRQLAAARHLPLNPAATASPPVVFSGSAEAMTLVAPLAAHHGPPGLRLIHLQVDPRAATLSVAYPLWGQQEQDSQVDETTRRVLLEESLESVRFAYFGRRSADDALAWHDDWRDSSRLPRAVRIVIEPSAESLRPALTLSTRLEAHAGNEGEARP
ncbi:prepilin-type N-terminal cleavage/methylation domain-containing protein [Halomonas urumqiensis]|nr:prepilin-type N-terminal cleavage/methylation domain-containing protein [Halomonas urumqiensis]GHE20918.1 hypothetical protein GCM10017767_14390 [Halomonas urumqiensis]